MAFSTHTNYRICRACLTAQTSFSYLLFENVSPDIYCFCTSVQVSEDEQLPRGICNSCHELLMKYSEFKRTCLQSEATLLNPEKDFQIKMDIKTECVENCEPNDIEEYEIKTEIDIHDNPVKVEGKEIGHDYIDEVDHHAEIKSSSPELLVEKHFKRKAKKLLKSKQRKGPKPKVRRKKFMHTCDVCQKRFNFKERFEAHKLEHEDTIAHLETPNQNTEQSFTCNECGKKFLTKTVLQSHIKGRHSERKFTCQVCSCTFTDKYDLSKHLRTHEGNKLYKCEICNNAYATRSTLTVHKRLHSGERPYVCNYCLKAFVSNERLTSHVRIHTGDKPHKCTLCEQRFSQRSSLTRHMKVHDTAASTLS